LADFNSSKILVRAGPSINKNRSRKPLESVYRTGMPPRGYFEQSLFAGLARIPDAVVIAPVCYGMEGVGCCWVPFWCQTESSHANVCSEGSQKTRP